MWTHLIERFGDASWKIRLALPCIGLDSLCTGLREMRFDAFEVLYAYDTDAALLPHLLAVHGPIGLGGPGVGVGRSGDLLRVDVTTWQRVDFLMSGPPCPPWSSIGKRLCADDVGEKVFEQVTRSIEHQALLGAYGFLIEMVPGMDYSSSLASASGEQSYYTKWVERLRRTCPMYHIHTWQMQTSDYLPQNRLRLYTVGVHRDFALDGLPPPPAVPRLARVNLADVLHRGLCPIDELVLTPQQRANLTAAKRRLSMVIGRGTIACISVDRDPSATFGEYLRHDGDVCTLRTQNECLWLYACDGAGRTTLSRCLHPVERLALQGFRPEVALYFSKVDLLRVTGNACSVPVVTAVFRQLVRPFMHLAAFEGPQAVHRPLGPVVHGPPGPPGPQEWAAGLAKMHRLNTEREEIALLERESQLLQR